MSSQYAAAMVLCFWAATAEFIYAGGTDKEPTKRVVVENVESITDIAVSADGEKIAYAEDLRNSVTVRNLKTNQVATSTGILPGEIRSLSFSPNEDRLAIAVGTGLVLWDTKEKKWKFDKTPGYCLFARFSPDGKFLVNNFDGGLAIWTKSGEHVKYFSDHKRLINDGQFSGDGKLLATCCTAGNVIIYDMSKLTRFAQKTFENEQVQTIAFIPDSKLLLVGTISKLIIWDYQADKNLHVFDGLHRIATVYVTKSGGSAYVCSHDRAPPVLGQIPTSEPRSGSATSGMLTKFDLKSHKRSEIQTDKRVNTLQELSNGEIIVAYGIRLDIDVIRRYGAIEVWTTKISR